MIIIMQNNQLNKEAAKLLAKKDNDGNIIEPIQKMYEVDFKNITDDTLTILDITGDGNFQKDYPGKVLAMMLLERNLPTSIKKIQIIVSDVDWKENPVVCVGREMSNYLQHEGRAVDVYTYNEVSVGPTCISLDKDKKEWKIEKYSQSSFLNGSSKNGFHNKELWSGKDIRDKLVKHEHYPSPSPSVRS
jgi:hypothetical protein